MKSEREIPERELTEEERNKIIHELRYDLWNDFFCDAPYEKFREYPQDATYIIAKVGKFEKNTKTGTPVYRIRPIKLFPIIQNREIAKIHTVETIQSLFVTTNIKKEKDWEGKIIFCRINYREEKYLNSVRIFYSAHGIVETAYTAEELLELSNRVMKTYIENLEAETKALLEKKEKREKEKNEYSWFCDNYERLVTMLKDGRNITLEELEKENAGLVDELKKLAEESDIYQIEKDNLKEKEAIIKSRKEALNIRLKALNELKIKTKKKNDEVIPQITEIYKDATANQKKILTQSKNKFDEINSQFEELEKQFDELKEKIIRLERISVEKNKNRTAILNVLRGLNSEIRELTSREEKLQKEQSELEQIQTELDEVLSEKRKNNEDTKAEIVKKEEELTQMLADYKSYISEQKGEYIHFLKKYTDALNRVEKEEIEEINKFLEQGDFTENVHEELVHRIVRFLWNRGQYYKNAERTVTRFVSAVGSGQIILICGAPGCGKSSLPHYIGAATGAEVREIIIQPNWTDSQDILGYYNSNDKSYVHTPFLDALIDAEKDEEKGKQYFIVLDEMNLAHVEYYFSTILSAMELDGRLSVISRTELDELEQIDNEECEILRKIRIPENVQFIGTLNIDEISKNISPKVIDRSVIIELTSETDENQIKETVYGPESLQPVKNTWRIYKYPPDIIGLEKDKNDDINPAEETIMQVEAVYKAVDDFYNAYKQRIYGAPVILSARCRKRIEYMAKRGANTEDIILGRLLPCVNWEMTETVFDVFKEKLLGE
ncbi:MAG: AAA family ATPase, partial [Lachnospiraceae bacterium]|nr:AAA family ATPase [Lachnospiraceae bacterium]